MALGLPRLAWRQICSFFDRELLRRYGSSEICRIWERRVSRGQITLPSFYPTSLSTTATPPTLPKSSFRSLRPLKRLHSLRPTNLRVLSSFALTLSAPTVAHLPKPSLIEALFLSQSANGLK